MNARRHVVAAAALLALRLTAQEAAPPLRVGKITIRCENTFTDEEAKGSKTYRAMNRWRTVTRPSVIQRRLLFREGEPFDAVKLQETEKALRELPFLKAARVSHGPPHDGVVDILVLTQDSWTLVPGLPIASAGGTTTYGFQVSETDLFGSGRGLAFHYDKGIERISRSVLYDDPYVFDSEYEAHAAIGWTSDGWNDGLEIARPFRSATSLGSERLATRFFRQTTFVYEAQDVREAWQQDHRSVVISAARALTATDRRATRMSLSAEWLDDRFTSIPERPQDPLPANRTFRFLVAGWELLQNDLLRLDYVNRDLLVEDFNLGAHLTAQLGVSPPVLGADETVGTIRVSGSRGMKFDARSFLLGRASYETRLRGGTENAILSASLDFVWKLPVTHPLTFVAKGRYDRGWNLDRDVQFVADGLTGLRGYRLFSYTGDERLIVNLEQRFFSGKELMHLFSPGLALFFDAGDAAPAGRGLALKSDVGIGFRMAISRAPTDNVYRIDVAWPLDPDPKGRRGLLVSFSAAQGF